MSLLQQRRYSRVALSLPVRLRWLGPFGNRVEVGDTLDVSRGGLLIRRHELCRPGTLLWVTFPFDACLKLAQPETPARIVRVTEIPHGFEIALEFEPFPSRPAAASCHSERRSRERIRIALPVRLRPLDSPFSEETMTVDISDEGVLLWTLRIYAAGDTVLVEVPNRGSGFTAGRWTSGDELPARVVHTVRIPGAVEQQIALERLPRLADEIFPLHKRGLIQRVFYAR